MDLNIFIQIRSLLSVYLILDLLDHVRLYGTGIQSTQKSNVEQDAFGAT